MRLIDRAKANRRRAARAGVRRIMFCHVPKSAGTSLARSIRVDGFSAAERLLLADFVLNPMVSGTAATALGADTLALRQQVAAYHLADPDTRYVTGHVPCPPALVSGFEKTWNFVTILRDPVAMFVSSYVFNRYKTNLDWARIVEPIEEYLETERARDVASTLVRYFSSSAAAPAEADGPRLAREAADNLGRFALVGTVEAMDAWIAGFEATFGRRLRVPHLNRSPRDAESERIRADAGLMRRIAGLCAADTEIYRAVCRIAAARPRP